MSLAAAEPRAKSSAPPSRKCGRLSFAKEISTPIHQLLHFMLIYEVDEVGLTAVADGRVGRRSNSRRPIEIVVDRVRFEMDLPRRLLLCLADEQGLFERAEPIPGRSLDCLCVYLYRGEVDSAS